MPVGGIETGASQEPASAMEEMPRSMIDLARKGMLASAHQQLKHAVGCVPNWTWALIFYVAMAGLTIGRHVLGHPTTVCACVGTEDPAAYMWGLSWWPHAIAHGLNPFYTHYLWSPTGVNVAQAAMIPTAAILVAPVTELAGPIASYNLLSIASPVLAAVTAYLLCRRIVRRELPAIVGGYLFGFSAYDFGHLTGQLNLTLIFLIPVMVHVVLRRVDRELSRRTYIAWMALLILLQAGLSTELLAECVAFGGILLLSSRFLVPPRQRASIDSLIAETIGAGLIALLIGSPFFYYSLFSGGLPWGTPEYWDVYAQDLLNPLFPTYATWLGHSDFFSLSTSYVGGGVTGADGYLSIPIIIGFLLWAFGERRRRTLARLVSIGAGITFLAAMGAHLHIAGHQTITLPFSWVRNLPLFRSILPSRIAVFTSLAVSIGIAAWLVAAPTGRAGRRWLVVLLGVVMLFPNITTALYGRAPHNPRFFSAAMYKRYLASGETVMVLPFGYRDMSDFWQAEAGFSFYMPEGYISQAPPAPFITEAIVNQLQLNVAPSAPALGSFIREHRVSHVIVDSSDAGAWPDVMKQLGLHGRLIGEVLLYAVPMAPA